jgi:hypothetical protein
MLSRRREEVASAHDTESEPGQFWLKNLAGNEPGAPQAMTREQADALGPDEFAQARGTELGLSGDSGQFGAQAADPRSYAAMVTESHKAAPTLMDEFAESRGRFVKTDNLFGVEQANPRANKSPYQA